MKLKEFAARLRAHDWFHEMSDAPRVYEQGHADRIALAHIANESPAHRALYDAWRHHKFSGGPAPDDPREGGSKK